MIGLALRGLAARRLRSTLTAIAVLLGVAMISGTYVQTDQIRTAFDDIEQAANAGMDVVVTRATAFDSNMSMPEPIPDRHLKRVQEIPGVRLAEGVLWESGTIVVDGEAVEGTFAPTIVVSAQRAPINPFRVVSGRMPARSGEVAVDRQLAEDKGLQPGDHVGLGTNDGVAPVTLVGVVNYGDVGSIGGAQIVVAPLADLQRWYDRAGLVTEIDVVAAEGTTPAQLAARVDAVLPGTLEVKTAARDAADDAEKTGDAIGGFMTPALLALAGASLLVGAFIIFNTFSITVAQRTREFALLRAIGATRRQILVVMTLEAALIGVLASVAGLFAGLGIARFMGAAFDAAGMGIPRGDMQLAGRTIAVSLAVGIGVTLLSALAPAIRAMRVAPVAAMREQGAEGNRPVTRRRRLLAGLVLLGGMVLLAQGLFGGGAASARLSAMGGGTLLVFVGVALTARVLVRPLAAVIGWPLERLSPTTGQLARENTAGNSARTATTAGALMVGLGLVVFVAVFAHGMKTSFTGSVERLFTADVIVSTDMGTPFPQAAVPRIAATDGVAATCTQSFDDIRVNGKDNNPIVDIINGTDPATLGRMYEMDWIKGSDVVLDQLGPGAALVEEQFAITHELDVGDRFAVQTPSGGRTRLRVMGTYRDPQVLQGVLVDRETFLGVSSVRDPEAVFVAFTPGADKAAVQGQLQRLMEDYPKTKVRNNAEYRDFIGEQFDRIVYLLYALLAMSVVISMFGIANSLFLTVHERTRELGVLRAIGATGQQVRQLIRAESVITSVIGGLLGTVVGLVFAYLTTLALDDWALQYRVPYGQLAVFLLVSVLVGVAGAVAPARRAARVDIVRAVGADQ